MTGVPGASRGYCTKHYQRWQKYGRADIETPRMIRDDPMRRFWSYVQKTDGCWLWTARLNQSGYGQFAIGGAMPSVHRLSYEALVGPIPDGLQLDHLCRVRNCVRPDHLEPVTAHENMRRGTSPFAENIRKEACPRGHEYTDENTWLYRGSRYCRECRRTEARERKRRMREASRVMR